MPLASSKLSVFYRQMAQQLAAGITFSEALRSPSPAPAQDCLRLAELAAAGEAAGAVIAAAGPWLPEEDRPFLAAAARAGRLPTILASLSERHAVLHSTRIRVALACAYPLLVYHFGALVFPFLRMINFEKGLQWNLTGYLAGVLAMVLPMWGGAALFWFLIRRQNAFALWVLDHLPAIGGYRKNQALADFAFALGNLLEAGLPIAAAWLDAGSLARSARLRQASEQIHTAIIAGKEPGPLLAGTGAFPGEFAARYRTGEKSGTLDASLLALGADHQAQANVRLTVASMLYPGLLFGAVALMVAVFVVRFYAGYFDMINHVLDGK